MSAPPALVLDRASESTLRGICSTSSSFFPRSRQRRAGVRRSRPSRHGPGGKCTFDQIEQWYGIARRTAQKGIQELLAAVLLHARKKTVSAPLSATGKTTHIHYSPIGKYGHDTRADLRKHSRRSRDERLLILR